MTSQPASRVHVRRRTAVPIEVIAIGSLPSFVIVGLPLQPGLRVLVLFVVCIWICDLLTRRFWLRTLTAGAQVPTALTIGQADVLTLEVSTWSRLELSVARPAVAPRPATAQAGDRFEIPLRPRRRELLETIEVHASRSSPIGLSAATDVFTIVMSAPVPVLPTPIEDRAALQDVLVLLSEVEPELGGLRPYQAGDRPSSVHWLSSSRAGEVLVRERIAAASGGGRIALGLRGHDVRAFESAIGNVRWLVDQLHQRGTVVELHVPGCAVAVQPEEIERALASTTLGEVATLPAADPAIPMYWVGP